MDKIEEPKKQEPYDDLLDSSRKKLGKKLGNKLLVEDDYIKPDDFVDHKKRKEL